MTPDPDFVTVGYVDECEMVHELRITRDGIGAAVARGWLVLDAAALGMAVPVRSKPDATGCSREDEDDGA